MEREIEIQIKGTIDHYKVALNNGKYRDTLKLSGALANLTAALFNLREGKEDSRGEEWKKD